MGKVEWIKLTTNMFDNHKIKHLRKLPDGNNIVLIWVMLLTMAGRCNCGGMIFLTENIPYTPKMLADELNFEENTVLLALEALERFGMISMDEDIFTIVGWEDHQNTEGLEKLREQNRLRKQKQRAREKTLLLESKNDVSHDMSHDSCVMSQQCHATEKEKEIDIDKYIYIVEYLNKKAGTKYQIKSKKTKSCIHARLEEGFTVDDFKTVIDKKCDEWIGTEFEKYLRPETLFGTKFENYLNAKMTKTTKTINTGHPPEANLNDLDDLF